MNIDTFPEGQNIVKLLAVIGTADATSETRTARDLLGDGVRIAQPFLKSAPTDQLQLPSKSDITLLQALCVGTPIEFHALWTRRLFAKEKPLDEHKSPIRSSGRIVALERVIVRELPANRVVIDLYMRAAMKDTAETLTVHFGWSPITESPEAANRYLWSVLHPYTALFRKTQNFGVITINI